jgi:hypothetical protein
LFAKANKSSFSTPYKQFTLLKYLMRYTRSSFLCWSYSFLIFNSRKRIIILSPDFSTFLWIQKSRQISREIPGRNSRMETLFVKFNTAEFY